MNISNAVVNTGTIIGRKHVLDRMNNQDSVSVFRSERCIVVAVADGCSSGAHSEVGAKMATRCLVNTIGRDIDEDPLNEYIWPDGVDGAARKSVITLLESVESLHTAINGYWCRFGSPNVVNDYMLFTIMVAAITPLQTFVFSVGDGCFGVDLVEGGPSVTILDSGPGNAPNYLGYRLLPKNHPANDPKKLTPVIHLFERTENIKSLFIGTDGCADMETERTSPKDFLTDPRYIRNRSWLQRRLVVLGETERLLKDDTTVAIIGEKV